MRHLCPRCARVYLMGSAVSFRSVPSIVSTRGHIYPKCLPGPDFNHSVYSSLPSDNHPVNSHSRRLVSRAHRVRKLLAHRARKSICLHLQAFSDKKQDPAGLLSPPGLKEWLTLYKFDYGNQRFPVSLMFPGFFAYCFVSNTTHSTCLETIALMSTL